MSLSTDPTFSDLKDNFVCGYKDIKREWYCGSSGKHEVDTVAVDTTNGAGPHNIQIFMLTDDGVVLNCLPGYWNSKDLDLELQLASKLNKVYHDPNLTIQQKDKIFVSMQLNHILQHPNDMVKRSKMQGFDRDAEFKKNYIPDTVRNINAFVAAEKTGHPTTYQVPNQNPVQDNSDDSGTRLVRLTPYQAYRLNQSTVDPIFKTTDEIMHERMAANPFVQYKDFDTGDFVAYGTNHYDKNEVFQTPQNASSKAKHGAGAILDGLLKSSPLSPAYNLIEEGTGENHFVKSESN